MRDGLIGGLSLIFSKDALSVFIFNEYGIDYRLMVMYTYIPYSKYG